MTRSTTIVLTSRARTSVVRSECESLVSLLAVGAVLLALLWGSSTQAATRATLRAGSDVYRAACVGCHGPEGTGAERALIGFEPPETFPDFTQCDQTALEENISWKAIIRDGGPARGFSQIMPAFGDALTDEQMDAVVGYLRSFCREDDWPRGELNLPRALATEKAFPESETVLTSSFNAQHAPGIESELGYERRIGKRSQLEVAIPFSFAQRATGGLSGGIGDVAVGLKHVLFSRLSPDAERGSIFSLQGEIALPTGDEARGFGTGEVVFTTFGAYDILFPGNAFLQLQGGVDLPRHTKDVPRTAFLHAALGKSIAEGDGYGRVWSPMLELTGERDLEGGTRTRWDVIPELQVTLNARQHVRADLGFRIPVTETADRPRQVMLYVLWDWFDGGLLEGW
jgi:mono/diheme cytochrome c family protein